MHGPFSQKKKKKKKGSKFPDVIRSQGVRYMLTVFFEGSLFQILCPKSAVYSSYTPQKKCSNYPHEIHNTS